MHSVGGMFSASCVILEGWKLIESRPSSQAGVDSFLSSPRARAWLAERYPALAGTVAGATPPERFAALLAEYGKTVEDVTRELDEAFEGPYHELYFLPDDPLEERNLAGDEPERVEAMLELLRRERERAAAARVELDEPPVIRPPTEAERRELDALGYGGG